MSAICLFGALCAVNQSVLHSKGGLDLFDPINSHINSSIESPCPSIFWYKQDSNEWYGEVNLENVDLHDDINLRLELIVDISFHSVSIDSKPVAAGSENCY